MTQPRKRHKWAEAAPALSSRVGTRASLQHEGQLHFKRLEDVNVNCNMDASVSSVRFHTSSQSLLAASSDNHARIFTKNAENTYTLANTLSVEGLSLRKADFVQTRDNKVLMAGPSDLYVIDTETNFAEKVKLDCDSTWHTESFVVSSHRSDSSLVSILGEQGKIGLVSLSARCQIASLRASGRISAARFLSNKQDLVTVSDEGAVHIWDLRMYRCKRELRSDHFISASALALSKNDEILAIGTNEGVISMHLAWQDGDTDVESTAKVNMSLTSAIDGLNFSHGGNLLLARSSAKKNALRIIDSATGYTKPGWPTQQTPLNFVHSSDFNSADSELAVGNARGKILLYSLL